MLPHGNTPAQPPAGTSEQSFHVPKSHQKSRLNISNIAKGRRSANFTEKETQRNTESPELFHEVKNYPEIQVLIWEGEIYSYLLVGDQFSHSVSQFPNGKETMQVDHTLKSWK